MRRRDFIKGIVVSGTVWPLAARAQQSARPLVGFLSTRAPEDAENVVAAFRRGLSEDGFVDGQNIAVEFRWSRGQDGLLPAIAAELVSRRVDVLVATGGDVSALAAKQATSIIPIVFSIGSDPVRAGLVKSFNQPGGNVTGVAFLTNLLEPKRLSLLLDVVPGVRLVGVLVDQSYPSAAQQLQDIEQAAGSIGQQLSVANASADEELDAAFAALAKEGADALLVTATPYFLRKRSLVVGDAERQRLPAIYPFRDFAVAGGLLSYGASFTDAYRQAGVYTAKILKGAKPAELPVVQPTKFELVINRKTAKALSLTIPPGVLAIADEVIE